MTLAAIVLNVLLIPLAGLVAASPAHASTQSPDESNPSAQDQAQPNPPAQQGPSEQASPTTSEPAPSSATPSQKPATAGQKPASKSKAKKKVLLDNCNPTPSSGTTAPVASTGDKNGSSSHTAPPANSSNGSSSSGSPSNGSASNGSASNGPPSNGSAPAQATPAPTNCPPRVVVKQGSTSEPPIQLVGGTPSAPDRNTAIQMLQTAEENLRKINGQQLSSTQKDMVTQVRQFMDQSKTATAAGDLERARTLAWKAQTLSEELANPQR